MKKAICGILCLLLISAGAFVLAACDRQNEGAGTAKTAVDGNLKTYYETDDGRWTCDGIVYEYRLVIKGRMPNAAVDTTFVYLSNVEEISFEQAYKAAGVSSDSGEYFSPEEAVLVEME